MISVDTSRVIKIKCNDHPYPESIVFYIIAVNYTGGQFAGAGMYSPRQELIKHNCEETNPWTDSKSTFKYFENGNIKNQNYLKSSY